jgi:hypothetical protein
VYYIPTLSWSERDSTLAHTARRRLSSQPLFGCKNVKYEMWHLCTALYLEKNSVSHVVDQSHDSCSTRNHSW